MTEADPQLLSLLQKIANPLSELNLNINLKGVFAPPEQWKTTDEANPNIFTYSVQFLNRKFISGKIQPKKNTEIANSQNDDKNKKGAKKQVKEQQKPVQQDPQIIRKRKQWQALPQQEKFNRTSQDPEKMYSLKFPANIKQQNLEKSKVQEFEQMISEGKAEIVLVRKPELTEDQIAKLKKSKSKTLNIAELYQAKYKGIIDLLEFQTPGCKNFSQRIKFSFSGEVPADGVKIQTESTYALIEISLDKALSPEVVEIKPQLKDVLPDISNLSFSSINVIQKLKKQITRGIRAINQDYIILFMKQKQCQDDKKMTGFNNISTLRLNQINKRKDMFLNDFSNSGKFATLKERIGYALKAIIVDKFRKEKGAGKISKEQVQVTLAEFNVFFKQFVAQTIDYVLMTENSSIHEDILLNHETSKACRKQSVSAVICESKDERQARIAEEYETVNRVEKTEQKYLNLVLINKQSVSSLQKYAQFLCKNKKFDVAYQIYKKINQKSNDVNHKFILSLFMVQRGLIKQVLEMLTEMIQSERSSVHQKILYNNLISFMYEMKGDVLRSEKYLAMAEKYFQIKKNPHLKINPPKNPYLQPKPMVPKPERYTSQLSNSESQQMIMSLIQIIEQNHFYDLISRLLSKLNLSTKKLILTIKVQLFNCQCEQAISLLDEMLEKEPRNLDLLQMKADVCYKSDKIFECEQVFLLILKQKPAINQAFKAYLRLGYTYINRKSWEDAKATFQKVCEIRNNCSLGWSGLGIALLQLGQLKSAEQAFSMCSIYDPLSKDVQYYLQVINKMRHVQNSTNYKYLQQF